MKYILTAFILMLPIIIFAQQTNLNYRKSVTVSVLDRSASYRDTLFLMYYPNTLNNIPTQTGDYIILSSTIQKDSLYHFIFPVNKKSGNFFLARKVHGNDSIYHVNPSLKFVQLRIFFSLLGVIEYEYK